MEALRAEGLFKYFGGVCTLNNVSFKAEVGERLAVIGPNGAGKTTLFNVIDGQLATDGGYVFFLGQDITHLPAHRRVHLGLARSFQVTTLFFDLTVLNNVLLAIHGTQRSRFELFRPITSYRYLYDKAHEWLEFMDLWNQKDELVKALSYGEQRKLEIAVSMAANPKLLLLDEPSCGLTTVESDDISARIRRLGSDITVILIDHDLDLVFGVADRIIVLNHGQIITMGTCTEVRRDPRVREIYMGSKAVSGDVETG